MVVAQAAQRLKEAEITEQDSLLLTRNLLRIAIFNISYIRGLFPEKYFNDKNVPALEMKIKKLMPMDAESRRLIDWMEKGVYDALQKKYLKTLQFCICENVEGPMIEEYSFSFSYSDCNGEEVSMNVSKRGNKKQGATFKSNPADITPDQMRSSACKMVRTLVQLMRTLDQMPDERTILMKLLYYDDVTPEDYEPPFFRTCSENEANNIWSKNPLRMEVGNVNSKHLVLALKVKSVLDPCEDDNDGLQDDEVSLGADSAQQDDSSPDSDIHSSQGNQYIVAPIGNKCKQEDNNMDDEENTQDAELEEESTTRLREWINSRPINTVDLADILANFPDISVAFAEEIVSRLLKEGLLSNAGKDSYTINKEKNSSTSKSIVKQEVEMHDTPHPDKNQKKDNEDLMYMKALYYALPLDYVTVTKLQSKLEGEANQNTVRKLIDKMVLDGFIKNTNNKKLGKRVIHSEVTSRKLEEVKNALEGKTMVKETDAQPFEFIGQDIPSHGVNVKDGSTCAGLHSIGSDLTRTRGRSDAGQNGSIRSEQTLMIPRGLGNTPTSKLGVGPLSSLESAVNRKENGRASDADGTVCSHSTQDKRSRKASTVKEPILQYVKRLKAQAGC